MPTELPSLAEINAAHPGALMIPLADAAPFVAKTPGAAYKLATRGGFPGAKKLNGAWMVNVRKLAEFIDADDAVADEAGIAPAPASALSKPKGRASRDETSKTVRPPPMSKTLLAMRGLIEASEAKIEQTQAELEFQRAVFSLLEDMALSETTPDAESGGSPDTP